MPSNNNAPVAAVRPSALLPHHQSNNNYPIPVRSMRPSNNPNPNPNPNADTPFTLEMMLQSPGGGYGYGNSSLTSYMNSSQDNAFSKTKEEPREDMFLESLLS